MFIHVFCINKWVCRKTESGCEQELLLLLAKHPYILSKGIIRNDLLLACQISTFWNFCPNPPFGMPATNHASESWYKKFRCVLQTAWIALPPSLLLFLAKPYSVAKNMSESVQNLILKNAPSLACGMHLRITKIVVSKFCTGFPLPKLRGTIGILYGN